MHHVFTDIRISRRLAAHVLCDNLGQIIGQYRQIWEVFDRLSDEGVTEVEFHGPGTVVAIVITKSGEVSQDSEVLSDQLPLLPWASPVIQEDP